MKASSVYALLKNKIKRGGDGSKLDIEILDALPDVGKISILYLIPKDGTTSEEAIYNKYAWNEKDSKFIYLGDTHVEVDVKDYVKLSDFNELKTDVENIKFSNFSGSRNLLQFPFTDGTTTINGLTFTENADHSVTVSGNLTEGATARYRIHGVKSLEVGETYTLCGCPAGGSSSSYRVELCDINQNNKVLYYETGSGTGRVFSVEEPEVNYSIAIRVSSWDGVTKTFYPMLVKGDKILPYEPYTPSISQLLKRIEALEPATFVNE